MDCRFIVVILLGALFSSGCLSIGAGQPDGRGATAAKAPESGIRISDTDPNIIDSPGLFSTGRESVNRSIAGLSEAAASGAVDLANGSISQFQVGPVRKRINGAEIRMYAYNGQIPGPLLRVKQGSTVFINVTNQLDDDTTVHWHGLRLDNQYDGVPGITQPPIKPGESFFYRLDFPDEGAYWYHTHVREELQQELGLYGVILVEPAQAGYYNPVNREEVLVLDDLLMDGPDVEPYAKNQTDFALMGRYGDVMLTNGQEDYALRLKAGEVVRFFILNTANVRPFNLSIEGIPLKMVGGDSGKYEREFFADSVVISPSERYIAEAEFELPGTYRILNRNPSEERVLGRILVEGSGRAAEENNQSASAAFGALHENPQISDSMAPFLDYPDEPADFTYDLTVDIPGATPLDELGRELMELGHDGIEWEDTMFGMNQLSTNASVRWIIRDNRTGRDNMDAAAQAPKDRPIKLLIRNDKDSLHPMQHVVHIHGTRFLVSKTDGVPNKNLVWKDSVLVPVGGTVELLVSFPNAGKWMMHCHIAEHLESGMMTAFVVR